MMLSMLSLWYHGDTPAIGPFFSLHYVDDMRKDVKVEYVAIKYIVWLCASTATAYFRGVDRHRLMELDPRRTELCEADISLL